MSVELIFSILFYLDIFQELKESESRENISGRGMHRGGNRNNVFSVYIRPTTR